jgi:rare lipoprotein A
MRPQLDLRTRRACAGLGAFLFAYSLAVSPATAKADAQGASLTMKVQRGSVRYGRQVVVSGRSSDGAAGRTVTLEFAPAGGGFGALASTKTGRHGAYRVAARLVRSGSIRVTVGTDGADAPVAGAATAPVASPTRPIAVTAAIVARTRHTGVLAGRRAVVSGTVRPGVAGRTVTLQGRTRGHWHALAQTVTAAGGRFRLRFRVGQTGSTPLRVRAAGDGTVATGQRAIGRLDVFRRVFVSWYGPGFFGGHLACGGTLTPGTLGVANKTLPCGTKVTLSYRGHTVRVPVIDRGPYVAGREYDLTAATKQRLHFGSTGTILATK